MIKNYKYTIGEERANYISHLTMAIITLIFIPISSVIGYMYKGYLGAASFSIFTTSMFLMFLSSALYHCMDQESRHKNIFRLFDHMFIYFAIAGSYTPIALLIIGGWKGTLILILQWSMVLAGVLYKSFFTKRVGKINLAIYLIMGWTVAIFLPTFIRASNTILLLLIIFGGLLYSAGAFVYARKSFKYYHLVWHILIALAAITHGIAILVYIP